jgi:hypothetical protein
MSFEAFHYTQKRVRTLGTREWKLWFSETDEGLDFRLLTKDSSNDCYISLNGAATLVPGDSPVMEDDNGDAYFADQYRFRDADSGVNIYLEREDRGLAWVVGVGSAGQEDCTFTTPGPLMSEIAG